MVIAKGLYYPFIHFRDEGWLKTAALYWPSMARIVPSGYNTRDSRTVRTLIDELDFVIDLPPQHATQDVDLLFIDFLRYHRDDVQQALARFDTGEMVPRGADDDFRGVAYIHNDKVSPMLRSALHDVGAGASAARPKHDGPDRGSWVAMDARLAAVYMAVLASTLAQRNGLCPTTDQVAMHPVTGGWSIERIASAVFGSPLSRPVMRPHAIQDAESTVAFLALDLVVPENIAKVPASRIVDIRRRCNSELLAFQEAVASVASSLASVVVDDAAIRESYLHDVVRDHFETPKAELERALRGLKLTSARALLSTKLELPALAGTAAAATTTAVHPLVAATAGAAVGLVNVAADMRAKRRETRRTNAAVSYLLSIEDGLGPDTIVQRVTSAVRRVARIGAE